MLQGVSVQDPSQILVQIYATPKGPVRLTDDQVVALQRAGVWESLKYTFLYCAVSAPTHSNEHIVNMLGDYPRRVNIGMLDPEYRDPRLPYMLTATNRGNTGLVPCETFQAALKCASEMFRCDIVTVPRRDFQLEFRRMAKDYNIVVLVI
jgi:hypothetical protein